MRVSLNVNSAIHNQRTLSQRRCCVCRMHGWIVFNRRQEVKVPSSELRRMRLAVMASNDRGGPTIT